MKSNVKQIIESIIESPKKDIKTQLEYLKGSLSEEDLFALFEELCKTVIELTNEDRVEPLSASLELDINKHYTELTEQQEAHTLLIEKIEYAASLVQPISDHSLRGTMFYMDKKLESDEDN